MPQSQRRCRERLPKDRACAANCLGTAIARDVTARCASSRPTIKEQPCPADTTAYVAQREEHELSTRVQAEFREMPGLTLTLPQASRLFSIEPTRCERVLGVLVDAGFLATDGRHSPARAAVADLRDSSTPSGVAILLASPQPSGPPHFAGRPPIQLPTAGRLRNENSGTREMAEAQV
jgi:hypothetical protein